jgi:imidazole glycerol-phosphate synthase subunit HisF
MLKHRIITTIMYDETGQVVKPVQFKRPYRRLGTLEQFMRVIEGRNIDELLFIDITATEQERKPNLELIARFAGSVFAPVTYCGGISSIDDISHVLSSGADKVAIKTHYELIYDAARKFGSQAVVGVIDYLPDLAWGGQYRSAIQMAEYMELQGTGEIILTDMQRDGMMNGYNLSLIYNIANRVKIPVIASGGCEEPLDMVCSIERGASAVAAGSMFLFTETTPLDCAKCFRKFNIPARLENETHTS